MCCKTKLSICCVLIYFVIILIRVGDVSAAFQMTLQEPSNNTITSNEQEILITASISGLPSASFFRFAFQKNSGDPYFGYMKNNENNWIKITSSQDCKNYVSVVDASASAVSSVVKIGDDNISENGTYSLKLRRYTSSCLSYLDSNAIVVNFALPTSTPTPTPTLVATPTLVPTKTPITTPVKTKTPLPTINVETPSVTPQVLAESTQSPSVSNPPKNFLLPLFFIISGLILIGVSIYTILKSIKKGYTVGSEKQNSQNS